MFIKMETFVNIVDYILYFTSVLIIRKNYSISEVQKRNLK